MWGQIYGPYRPEKMEKERKTVDERPKTIFNT
jgi:hypothetical protein